MASEAQQQKSPFVLCPMNEGATCSLNRDASETLEVVMVAQGGGKSVWTRLMAASNTNAIEAA